MQANILKYLILLQCLRKIGSNNFQIIGGDEAKIADFPHAVLIACYCNGGAICGGSILNQRVVLTAAHCLEDCSGSGDDKVFVKYGHEKIKHMYWALMQKFHIHGDYDPIELYNDIALVLTKYSIELGMQMKRVAILRYPKIPRSATVSGWGLINDERGRTMTLRYTNQVIPSKSRCNFYLDLLPDGTFCAGPVKGPGSVARGDSGSALMTKHIQLGLVSYKVDYYTLAVYTNVSYHFRWIARNAKKLYCPSLNNKTV